MPWLVFAVAAWVKVWKVGGLLRRQVRTSAWGVERFRADLERHWQPSQSLH